MKVILTGATGYVGEGVLIECLNNPTIEKVLSIGRKPCGHLHYKLEEYIVSDLMTLREGDPRLEGYDAVFFCAGISSIGMQEEQYRVISHDIPLHMAHILPQQERTTFVYVSGAGNYNSSKQMWVRVKKSTEDALVAMPFRGAYNFRPAFMWPAKGMKHMQKKQYLFMIFYPLMRLFGGGNTLREVARAMMAVTTQGCDHHAISATDIRRLSKAFVQD